MEDIEGIVMIFGIFAGIFLLLGSVFLMIGLIRYLPTRHWEQVEGVIIEKEKKFHFSLDTIFNNRSVRVHYPDAKPTFQYEVEGQSYVKTSSMEQQPGFAIGSIVHVLYHPNNPQKAVINSIAQRGTVFIYVGLGVICIPILVLVIGIIWLPF